jgi:hypothetical protein
VHGELTPETKPVLMLLEADSTPALGNESLEHLAASLQKSLPDRALDIFEGESRLETHGVLYWQPLRIWISQPLSNDELDRAMAAAVKWANELRDDERIRTGRTRPVSISLLDWNGRPERRRLVRRGRASNRALTPRSRPRRPEPGRRLG